MTGGNMKNKSKMFDSAVDRLADRLENGHLLASMGGVELLDAAVDLIDDLRIKLQIVNGEATSSGKRPKKKCEYCGSRADVREWQRGLQGDAHGNPIRIPMCDACSRKYSGERRKRG
jgi:hypothetical protein